jgi:hypothetical protein
LSGLLQYTVSDYLPLVSSNSSCAYLTTFAFLMPGEQFRLPRASKLKYRHTFQGRIQDFKLGGAYLKKLRRARTFLGYFVWKITILRQKIIFFFNCRGRRENFWGISCEKSRFYAKKSGERPPPLNPPLHLNLSHCILWDWKEDICCCILGVQISWQSFNIFLIKGRLEFHRERL